MSVILTNMKMPIGCYTCKLKSICEYGIANEWLFEKRADECPLREERKMGRWIKDDKNGFLCSVCNSGYKNQPTCMGKPMFIFCPCCGAKMEGER